MSEEVGTPTKRRGQAEVIGPVYEVMKRELGTQRAQEIIEEAITADTIRDGKLLAIRDGLDVQSFARGQYL